MRRAFGWAVFVLVASCAQPDHAAQTTPLFPKSTVVRSGSSSFLGIPGLTQVTESTHTDDEWGYSEYSRVLVYRGEAVVCELPADARTSHENHSGHRSSQIEMSSREPLRFHVRESWFVNELSPSASCTGYELPKAGSCRTLFEHPCMKNECKLTSKVSVVPGIGVIRGQITEDGHPLSGVTVVVESRAAISDEHGGFVVDAGVGAHDVMLEGISEIRDAKAAVSMSSNQDADVSIAIECRWVENEQTCCAP
jgi:hypothetical protein